MRLDNFEEGGFEWGAVSGYWDGGWGTIQGCGSWVGLFVVFVYREC